MIVVLRLDLVLYLGIYGGFVLGFFFLSFFFIELYYIFIVVVFKMFYDKMFSSFMRVFMYFFDNNFIGEDCCDFLIIYFVNK